MRGRYEVFVYKIVAQDLPAVERNVLDKNDVYINLQIGDFSHITRHQVGRCFNVTKCGVGGRYFDVLCFVNVLFIEFLY